MDLIFGTVLVETSEKFEKIVVPTWGSGWYHLPCDPLVYLIYIFLLVYQVRIQSRALRVLIWFHK